MYTWIFDLIVVINKKCLHSEGLQLINCVTPLTYLPSQSRRKKKKGTMYTFSVFNHLKFSVTYYIYNEETKTNCKGKSSFQQENNSWRQDSFIEYLVMIQALCCDICPALYNSQTSPRCTVLSQTDEAPASISAHAGLHIWGGKKLGCRHEQFESSPWQQKPSPRIATA